MSRTLDRLEAALTGALAGLDESATARRREPGKWSVHEIAEHLLLSYAATESNVRARLAKGTAASARPSFGQGVGRFMITVVGYFPAGRKSPEMVVPRVGERVGGETLCAAVRERLGGVERVLCEAEEVFGSRVRSVTHPILGPMTPKEWRQFHLRHGLHHVRQIRRTMEQET